MRLSSLFEGAPNIEIKSLMTDSRVASKRALFFCVKGMVNDGHKFIDQAKENGAVAIVHSDDLDNYDENLVYIKVNDVKEVLNQICDKFYNYPSKKLKVLAVTGTNGKSTIAWVMRYLVGNYIPCGYIGTIGIVYNDKKLEEHFTTPDCIEMHETLSNMVDDGIQAVTCEISSQGLDLHRVDSVDFDSAVFTNLTQDHLDYHITFENYYQAKAKLFHMLSNEKPAIINIDDEYGKRLSKECTCRVVTYSLNENADYQAKNISYYPNHTDFVLVVRGEEYQVSTSLIAKFNVYNLIACIASVHETLGYPIEDLIKLVKKVPQVLGRVELVDLGQDFTVLIDYAHTPDGFENFLSFVKDLAKDQHRVITVFGSAGLRDAKKRPIMGKIADKYSDIIILTEEDYRTEDPKQIAEEIKAGIENHSNMIILDRYEAIRQGIMLANSGDIVVVLGKGDEDYMFRGKNRDYYQGDQNVAIEVLKDLNEGGEYENQ